MTDEKFEWECTDICPHCDNEVDYTSPNDGTWTMTCPHCGKEFKMCDKCYWIHRDRPCAWAQPCPAGNVYGKE